MQQRVSRERQLIGIGGAFRQFGRQGDFVFQASFTRRYQRPGDVGIRDGRVGAAKRVERLGVAQIATLAVAACFQPVAGAGQHGRIDVIADIFHIDKFQQTVGGQGFMAGVATKPFKALIARFKPGEFFVPGFQKFV